jgi:hypothetical protein
LARGFAKQPAAAFFVPSLSPGTKPQFDACPVIHKGPSIMLTSSPAKRARNRVDISTKVLARYWCKRFKKSMPEIEAAIAKVGDNAETVMKELETKREAAPVL